MFNKQAIYPNEIFSPSCSGMQAKISMKLKKYLYKYLFSVINVSISDVAKSK
jgi:hypothetical protein